MNNHNVYLSPMIIASSIALFFFLFVFSKCQTTEDKAIALKGLELKDERQKGAHVFGRIDTANFQFLTRNNIEWVTLVPWGSQKDFDSPVVKHHYGDSLKMLQRDSNWIKRLEMVHSAGFKVFVKPHVWIDEPSNGKWRSDVFPTSEENWKLWKVSYRNFILRYAKLAQQANAEMFCIGTELSRLSVEKPAFWKTLIQEVRGIYSGKITYAANWYNEYEKLTFWNDLDYIGIQAYFPLVDNKHPTVEQISNGWNEYIPTMKSIHKKHNRKILFTEMGYKSTADSAINPWEWIDYASDKNKTLSFETQENCYEAFFNTIWKEEWFAGVHIWQLRSDYLKENDEMTKFDFTPLKKPAEKTIATGFE